MDVPHLCRVVADLNSTHLEPFLYIPVTEREAVA